MATYKQIKPLFICRSIRIDKLRHKYDIYIKLNGIKTDKTKSEFDRVSLLSIKTNILEYM